MYPRGRASLKAVIDRLHAAGILAGLHTYAFFIDKSCPWVTPVPDRRLARDAAFTLNRPLGPEDTVVTVAEPTGSMSTVTGFFVRNSVTLQIGDELVTYGGVSKEPPYAFTGCTRGALGTKAAAHEKGASVCHLKECFGLFAPDGDSSLLEEVASATADTFNECGFDMMYLDALDGEDVLGGPENGWHYGSKFVFELWRRLNRPALMEMSTFHHHLWFVRSRLGAWDHPNRGHKRFIDLHMAANEGCRRMFLPAHLGWWAMKAWQGVQSEPTFTDDIEYLCGKCIGTDTGFSLMGIDPASFATSAAARRLAQIIKRYETLRHEGHFPEHVKARLREPGAEFRLEQCPDAKWRLRRTAYARHRVEALDGRSDLWRVRNEFSRQPIRLRIEALMSAAPYDDPDSVRLADFTDAAEFPESAAADGVAADLFSSDDKVRIGTVSGMFCAWRTRVPPRLLRRAARFSSTDHGVRVGAGSDVAWAKAGKTFQPPLDLGDRQALGVWIHGDGRGEILNVQTRSPEHVSGGIGDHYVVIDFRGWRYFELVETEGERVDDYGWPYSGQLYWIYREMVDYARLGSLRLWFNNIPPDGKVTCSLSPIKALRLVKATLRNPAITVGRHALTFPVDIESGSYLEFGSPDDCRLYDSQGAVLCDVKPMGDAPLLEAGLNELRFTCEPPDGVRARVRVTVMTEGPTVEG